MVSLLATTAATCQELTWIDNGSNPARRPIRPSTSPNKYSYTLMQLIRQTKAERELALCCDIHGHNRKKNIFICISEMIQMAVHQETTQRKSKYSPCWWVKIAEYSISKIVASKSKKIAKEPPEYHIIFIHRSPYGRTWTLSIASPSKYLSVGQISVNMSSTISISIFTKISHMAFVNHWKITMNPLRAKWKKPWMNWKVLPEIWR